MSQKPSNVREPRSWGTKIIYIALGILTVGILGTILVLMLGGVQGTEIDPNSYVYRDFHFYRIPFTKTQISPTWYGPVSNGFQRAIADHLSQQRSRKHEWQVAEVVSGTMYDYGDAKIMDNLFSITTKDVDESFWPKWSKENPTIANEFWPMVSEIGIHDAYIILPEFAETVRKTSTIDEFKQEAIPKLTSLYVELAEDYAEADNPKQVVTLTNLAIARDRNIAKAYALRADAHRRLGNAQQADEDLATSAELSSSG